MDKLLLFQGKTDKGIFTYVIDTEKSYLEKTAAEYHPTIASYINNAKTVPGKTQILLTALGAGEWWGCFPEGTPITLADGTEKPIELVEEGELVKTHTSSDKPVIRPMDRYYEGDLLTFGFRGWGSGLTCTTEHPIYGIKKEDLTEARRGYYKQRESYEDFISKLSYSFVKAEELQINDYVCVPFPTVEDGELALPAEDLAYVFGRYLADGVLVNRRDKGGDCIHTIVMVIGSDKKEDAEKIVGIVEKYGHGCSLVEKDSEHTVRLSFTWSDFAGTCLYHLGRGSKTKFISDTILRMPRTWQKEFLNGYLSGDGCQTLAKGRYYGSVRSSTVSQKIATGLCKIVARLGYSSGYFKCKQHHTCTFSANNTIYENSYERTFSKELSGRFIPVDALQSSCSSHIDSVRGYILLPVKSISSEHFEGTVYNLHVAENNSYISNNIAVHNCNINGDWFGEEALAHEGDDYGYKTFEKYAKVYRHHVNKDPSKSYGDIVLSVYNPVYHRVELIVTLKHDNASDIVQRIENGEYPDVSMGTKVPYDICSICGNRAPTRAQYCEHLRYYMGKIDPQTGKQAYAINTMPKFFDISFVLIGADRIAKTLRKVASGNAIPLLSSAYLAEKMAERQKAAEIKKEIPPNQPPASMDKAIALTKSIMEVKSMEPALPKPTLDSLAEEPLGKSMSTMIMMGILPKPQEFQRIFLVSSGHKPLADKLDQVNACFDPAAAQDWPEDKIPKLDIGAHNFDEGLMSKLLPFMEDRSYFPNHLGKRIVIMIKKGEEQPQPRFFKVAAEEKERKPFGPAIPIAAAAAAYYALTRLAPKETLRGIDKVLSSKAGLGLAAVIGLGLIRTFNTVAGPGVKGQYSPEGSNSNPDANDVFARIEQYKQKPFTKISSPDGVRGIVARRLLGVPLAYMASGVLQKHKELSPYDEEGRIRGFIRRNPDVISAALIADAMLSGRGLPVSSASLFKHVGSLGAAAKNYLPKFPQAAKVANELCGYDLIKTADAQEFLTSSLIWPLAMGKANLPGRIVGGLFDQAAIEAGSKLLERRQKAKSNQVPK